MSRDLHPATEAATRSKKLAPIGLVEMLFDDGPVRLWTGYGELTWNGHVWTGAGDGGLDGKGQIGRIGQIEETIEIRAVGIELELSGTSPEVLHIALNTNWQGRAVNVYFAVLQGRSFVGEPLQIFGGLLDQLTGAEGDQATIKFSCESNQIDLERTRARRWTPEDQKSIYPADKGLDAVAALQEVEIRWGMPL
jgi:hypothetical protein